MPGGPLEADKAACSKAGSASGTSSVRSRRLTTKTETRTPTNAMIAPAINASWNPFVSANAGVVPLERSLVVVDVAIAESAAIPSAPPICCEVLSSPDARPASAGCTPASAAIEIGTNEKPIPNPTSRKPGSKSVT